MRLWSNLQQAIYGNLTINPVAGVGVTINAATSSAALTINAVALAGYLPSVKIVAPNTTSQSNGLTINAGTNSSDAPLVVSNATAAINFLAILGDSSWSFSRAASTATLASTAAGNISIGAPSSGVSLSVTGTATVGSSLGVYINAGTNSSDYALYCVANGSQALLVRGDGGLLVGSPTGADEGLGTINVQSGIYLNGKGVYSGIPQNAQGGASYTLVASDTGKHIWISRTGSSTITVPSGVFSVGDSITIVYESTVAGSLVSSGVTIYWFPSNATGTRTLGTSCLCTLLCVQSNVFVLTGTGLS